MSDQIIINDTVYTYIKDRLMGGKIYVSGNKKTYLRVGDKNDIAGEQNITEELFSRGFPVPKVLDSGVLENGDLYFIENSIGEDILANVFSKDTKEFGNVKDESFEVLISLIKKYCEVQFDSKNYVPHDSEYINNMIGLENTMRNNPPSEEMEKPFFDALDMISKRLLELPFGYIQADLNVYNILPEGIIDFELSHFGPVGYDVLTCVFFGRMWPKNNIRYVFTDEQIERYIKIVNEIASSYGLPLLSDYVEDFLVLKNIWGTGKDKNSEDNPELHKEFWGWRIKVRDYCIRQYLKGKKIDTNKFEEIGSALSVE